MVIGNGLLAKAFLESDYPIFKDWVIFASGVSDSNETNETSFKREKDLLAKTLTENTGLSLIYFSSVLVGISDKPYYKHKLEMENMIKESSCNHIILRIPQIVGLSGNKNNVFNHFQENILNNRINIIYEGVERALIDVGTLVQFVVYVMERTINETIIFSHVEKINVLDLCLKIAKKLEIDPIISLKEPLLDVAGNWNVESSQIVIDWLDGVNVGSFTDNVIEKYIKK